MVTKIAPFGGWKSPISAEMVAQSGMSSRGTMRDIFLSQSIAYWRQLRVDQQGRYDLLRAAAGEEPESILPLGYSVSSRVHEYGGGALFVHEGVIYFSNDADQRLYRMVPGDEPVPISPEPPSPKSLRYADGRCRPDGNLLVTVQEVHQDDGLPLNRLVRLPIDGHQPPHPIAEGHDFYSSPRFSPTGDQLLFLTWDHPRMPWDGTELWLANLDDNGDITTQTQIAGGPDESIFQPEWGPQGSIYFISDRTDWWNLYRWQEGETLNLSPVEADLGTPAWNFGFSRYAFLNEGRIACLFTEEGVDQLGIIHAPEAEVKRIDLPFTAYYLPYLRSDHEHNLWFLASSPTQPQALYRYNTAASSLDQIHQPASVEVDLSYVSRLQTISFPTGENDKAYAFLYPPQNPEYDAPAGERSPLIMMSHGGPTAAAIPQFHLEKLFWTSRGFTVADINYRGSTGYGRAYRDKLKGKWGLLDVEDCVNLARYLSEQGYVDPAKLLIRGSSAGGYATLAAIAFHDVFDAGASYYGVADIEGLARHTHKFEAHYLDSMIGPYPEAKDLYRQRSPIHHMESLSSPLILFQGLEDKIVPPEQAEQMAAALDQKGLPYALLKFEGESHGFDQQSTVVRALTAELYFYSRVLGFELEERVEPIEIHNLKHE